MSNYRPILTTDRHGRIRRREQLRRLALRAIWLAIAVGTGCAIWLGWPR